MIHPAGDDERVVEPMAARTSAAPTRASGSHVDPSVDRRREVVRSVYVRRNLDRASLALRYHGAPRRRAAVRRLLVDAAMGVALGVA